MAPIMEDGRGNFAGKPGAMQNINLHMSGFTAEGCFGCGDCSMFRGTQPERTLWYFSREVEHGVKSYKYTSTETCPPSP